MLPVSSFLTMPCFSFFSFFCCELAKTRFHVASMSTTSSSQDNHVVSVQMSILMDYLELLSRQVREALEVSHCQIVKCGEGSLSDILSPPCTLWLWQLPQMHSAQQETSEVTRSLKCLGRKGSLNVKWESPKLTVVWNIFCHHRCNMIVLIAFTNPV